MGRRPLRSWSAALRRTTLAARSTTAAIGQSTGDDVVESQATFAQGDFRRTFGEETFNWHSLSH